MALLHLFGRRDHWRYPLVLMSTALTVAAAGVQMPRTPYIIIVTGYAAMLAVLLRSQMRVRSDTQRSHNRLMQAVVFTFNVAVLTTLLVSVHLKANFPNVNRVMFRMFHRTLQLSAIGFDEDAGLGDVHVRRDDPQAERIVLRVFSDRMPGYLRGKAYKRYIAGRWVVGSGPMSYRLRATEERRAGQFVLPGRSSPGEEEAPQMTIHPVAELGAHFFLPLEATAVQTASKRVRLFPGNILQAHYRGSSSGYQVWTDDLPVRRIEERRVRAAAEAYLHPPADKALRSRLDEVIATHFPGVAETAADDPGPAVAALATYFDDAYDYRIGVDFDEGQDPLFQWLDTDRHGHGHCELFASAGTLLLRRMGVRARYVTGFLCDEPCGWGGLWLTRNRDAHAWVEYYHPQNGWTVAEFTPADGQPRHRGEPRAGLLAYLGGLWERMKSYFMREGVLGLFTGLLEGVAYIGGWMIDTWGRVAILLALLAAFVLYRVWRGRHVSRSRRERELPPEIAVLQARFYRLEKTLARRGWPREPTETIAEYRARLAAADIPERAAALGFLAEYESIRYAPFE